MQAQTSPSWRSCSNCYAVLTYTRCGIPAPRGWCRADCNGRLWRRAHMGVSNCQVGLRPAGLLASHRHIKIHAWWQSSQRRLDPNLHPAEARTLQESKERNAACCHAGIAAGVCPCTCQPAFRCTRWSLRHRGMISLVFRLAEDKRFPKPVALS